MASLANTKYRQGSLSKKPLYIKGFHYNKNWCTMYKEIKIFYFVLADFLTSTESKLLRCNFILLILCKNLDDNIKNNINQ